MKEWAVSYLCCPACKRPVESVLFEADARREMTAGVLVCRNRLCRAWYPVIAGVPRLLDAALRAEVTQEFVAVHNARLRELGLPAHADAAASEGSALTHRIMRNFGFEWSEYARFGWDDPEYHLQREQRVFHLKSLLEPPDLDGKLVLDAGCGNGRYSHWAAASGAQVIGVDLSDAVDAAARNTAALANVQIVQADIFNLPFRDCTFDAVFSIGVLMCTRDAAGACRSLARVLRSGGSLSVHVYGKGNVFYEAIDRVLRSWTTRMSIPELRRFTAGAYRLRGWLQRLRLIGAVGKLVRLDSHPHCIFDWYAAPIATHHTYAEVKGWFGESNLVVIASRERTASAIRRLRHALIGGPGTVTLRGRVAPAAPPTPPASR